MNLTPAMQEYLCRAMNLGANDGHGVYFSLWAVGRTSTGRALSKRGLIEPYLPGHNWPFIVTDAGVRAWTEIPFATRQRITEGSKRA